MEKNKEYKANLAKANAQNAKLKDMFMHYTGKEYTKNFNVDQYLQDRYKQRKAEEEESDSYGIRDKQFAEVEKKPEVKVEKLSVQE